jgi:Na+-driven multidrug efflux pump
MTTRLPLTQRRIFFFWLPLAATWLMMAVEGPYLAALIARLTEPEYNLAAFGVAFSFALLAEAPVIMLMSAATALVQDRKSYFRMRSFTHGLNALVTAAVVVLLLPPVFEVVVRDLMGLPPEVSERTRLALLLLLPWPGTIGFRRFYQGVLIGHGQTRRVAYGTILRLVTMTGTGLALARGTDLDGAAVGAAALSVGVTVEAVASRVMADGAVRSLVGGGDRSSDPMSYIEIARFYLPLALTAVLALGVQPLVTFFVARGRLPVESLAVLPVINSLVFIFRSVGLAYQEVGIALMGDHGEGFIALRRFAWLLGSGVVVGLGLIAWTPLGRLWFEGVSGLTPELARLATAPARILVLLPGLAVVLSFQRAVLVHAKKTVPVTTATLVEVAGIVAVLVVGVFVLDAVGIVAAAVALALGRLAANVYLAPVLRSRPINHDSHSQ